MNGLNFRLFDIFSYTLPGMVFLTSMIFFLNDSITSFESILSIIKEIKTPLLILIIIISYIIGFSVIDYIGSFLHDRIGKKIWKNYYPNENTGYKTDSNRNKLVIVREFSPRNFSYLQMFKQIKSMSHNLSAAFLIFFLVLIYKIIASSYSNINGEFIFLSIFLFLTTIVLLYEASVYDSYYYNELNQTVESLNFDDKLNTKI